MFKKFFFYWILNGKTKNAFCVLNCTQGWGSLSLSLMQAYIYLSILATNPSLYSGMHIIHA